tara:strand:- start:1099 stop:1713 length:615 start_codon:yes stop_codon:yes gene_type:complete
MLFEDTYKEIAKDSVGYYREKGSKFIGYCYLVKTKKEIKKKIEIIKKKEKSANHYCFAYLLNIDKSICKVSDDGEPSYTAGKPILGQIKSCDLTNILIVVVRYFGGTKLGIPGLIRSYKTAAINAINKTKIITKNIHEEYDLFFKYSFLNNVMKKIKQWDLSILERDYNLNCKIKILVSKKKSDMVFDYFNKHEHIKIKYVKSM